MELQRAGEFAQYFSGSRVYGNMDPTCKFPPGVMTPEIKPSRCEAKGPCVLACPYDVLVIRFLTAEERAELTPIQRFRTFVHGNKRAFVVDQDACRGCGLCVEACPEDAIKLKRREAS